MTARVTSSASLSLGVMPTGGRGGASCGDACSSSSIFTYSAVARVSRSASTRPPTRSTLGSNADHGHPRPHAGPLGINRLGVGANVIGVGFLGRVHAHEVDAMVVEPTEGALQLGLVDDLDSQDRLVAGRLDDNTLQRLGEAL